MTFRPEFEGLRALAILLVVSAHAGIPGLAGGFVGVDVFFVLSGFLISGVLAREYEAKARINFFHFYIRRFKRLFPALMLMLLVTSVLGLLLLSPAEQAHQAEVAAFVPLWLSNLYFAFLRMDYFAPESHYNMFLHTWSLAVEEQFYLVWPVFLFLFLRYLGPLDIASRERIGKHLLLGVIVLSFLLNLHWSSIRPSWAFYLMPARI